MRYKFNKLFSLLIAIMVLIVPVFSNITHAENDTNAEESLIRGKVTSAFAKWTAGADYTSNAIDGIVSYGNNPANRWTDWRRTDHLKDNWLTIVFGSDIDVRDVMVSSLDIDFYYDSGCALPQEYYIEYFTGDNIDDLPEKYGYAEGSVLDDDSNWTEVNYTLKDTAKANATTRVEFDEVKTKAIRIKMIAQENKSLAITEVNAFGKTLSDEPVKETLSTEELTTKIKNLQHLKEDQKNDFLGKIGGQTNTSVLREAERADYLLSYYDNIDLPTKPDMPELKAPIYGGWFRSWHDQNSSPDEDRPNYFGSIPGEVDLAFVFADHTKEYSEFWRILAEEYVPEMNARGTRVLKTITVRQTYLPIPDTDEDFPNTPEGNKARAEYLVNHHITRFGLDGLDVDIEWHDTYYRQPRITASQERQAVEVMQEMSRILKSQGKLFMIDTNMTGSEGILTPLYDYVDYVMLQAYGSGSGSRIDQKWDVFSNYIEPSKFLLGFSFWEESDPNRWNDISDKVPGSRAEQYALWQPPQGEKAGIIGYAIDRDGVEFLDNNLYTTDYSLSKELKNLMLGTKARINAIESINSMKKLTDDQKTEFINELNNLRPNNEEEVNEVYLRAEKLNSLVDFGIELRNLDNKRFDQATIILTDSEGNVIEGSFNQYKQWEVNGLLPGSYKIKITDLQENVKIIINDTVSTQIGVATDTDNEFIFDLTGEETSRMYVALKLVELDIEPEPEKPTTGWIKEDGKWYYINSETYKAETGWKKDANNWYYLSPTDGHMLTRWIKDNGHWYYLDSTSGAMKSGWQKVDGSWYYLSPSSGAMQTGWQRIDNDWYYLDSTSGAMQTGWQRINNNWFYLFSSGRMATGWQRVDGLWYYLSTKSGIMQTAWEKIGNTWYYLNPKTGAMQTGWLKLGDSWYYLDSKTGAMKTGYYYVGNTRYYSNSSGVWIR